VMAMTPAGRAKLDRQRVEDPQLELPWGGRSPRHLTNAYKRFTLRDETAPLDEECEVSDDVIDEMYRRYQYGS